MTVKLYAMTCGYLTMPLPMLIEGGEGTLKIPIPAYLIEHKNGVALFDSGMSLLVQRDKHKALGPLEPYFQVHFEPGEDVASRLDSIGRNPEKLDFLINSHLHFDHAGGLLAPWQAGAPPKLLFPNAKFIVGRECWERAQKPHPRDRASFIPELPALLQASGRLEVIEGDQSPTLGPQVRFEYSHGHTPGLLLSTIGGEHGVTFCADLIPGRPWVHVPITMGYDRYPELLIDEKTKFLDDKLARGVRLFFTHDAECAMASVTRDANQRFGVTDVMAEVNELALAA